MKARTVTLLPGDLIGRDLAGRVPAHAIGHDEQPPLHVDVEGVFVVSPHLPHITCRLRADHDVLPSASAPRTIVRSARSSRCAWFKRACASLPSPSPSTGDAMSINPLSRASMRSSRARMSLDLLMVVPHFAAHRVVN
ncbi:MAG: hypothetical protein KC620_09800 [Myxococcales bacterium]|nr:hypothetical protein [Myxococcales bacterium]